MAFIRTTSGISNQHIFYGVDLVVFVEGGENSFTKDEVDNNFFSDHSIDVLFWGKLFDTYHPSKRIKYKAVGSKSTILKIAEEIINNNITTVYAAMDKEFDETLGNLIKHKNVLYTFGYSWENDAWNESLIKSILRSLGAVPFADEIVDEPYFKFLKDVKIGVYADGFQFAKGESFFPRPSGHMRCVECNINNQPYIKKVEIDNLLSKQGLNKGTLYKYGSRKSLDPKKDCYGHLFGDYCRHIVHHVLKIQLKVGSIGKEIVRRLVINDFINHFSSELRTYYSNQLE